MIIGGIGVVIAVPLIIGWIVRSSKESGVQQERSEENARQEIAKGKADEVLAERRNPDDAADRLQRGDF